MHASRRCAQLGRQREQGTAKREDARGAALAAPLMRGDGSAHRRHRQTESAAWFEWASGRTWSIYDTREEQGQVYLCFCVEGRSERDGRRVRDYVWLRVQALGTPDSLRERGRLVRSRGYGRRQEARSPRDGSSPDSAARNHSVQTSFTTRDWSRDWSDRSSRPGDHGSAGAAAAPERGSCEDSRDSRLFD